MKRKKDIPRKVCDGVSRAVYQESKEVRICLRWRLRHDDAEDCDRVSVCSDQAKLLRVVFDGSNT